MNPLHVHNQRVERKKMEPVRVFIEQRRHREGEAAAQQTCTQRRVQERRGFHRVDNSQQY